MPATEQIWERTPFLAIEENVQPETASSWRPSLSNYKFSNIIYFNGSIKKQSVLQHIFLPRATKETKSMQAFKIMNSDFF